MAVKAFEEVYASLSAEEKKLLDNTLAKHTDLKEGWLRQDDYSRKLNEFKTKETEFERTKDRNATLETWFEDKVPIWNELAEAGIVDKETGDQLWTKQKADLEAELAKARKEAVGGDMDPAELDKRVRAIVVENGGLSKVELEAVIRAEAKKLAEETFTEQWKQRESDFNTKTIPFVAGFSSGVAVIAGKYEKDTGKSWDAETATKFFDTMSKEQVFDPYKVYEKFVEPMKREKDLEATIEAKVQERLKKLGVPEGGDDRYIPQSEEKGALQQMLERSAGADDFETMIRAGAVKAAQELKAEGKG